MKKTYFSERDQTVSHSSKILSRALTRLFRIYRANMKKTFVEGLRDAVFGFFR